MRENNIIRVLKIVVLAKILTACGPKQQELGRAVYDYQAKTTVERLPVMADVHFAMDTADSVSPDTSQLPCDTVYFYDTIKMPGDTVVVHDTIVLSDTTCTDCMTIINNVINNGVLWILPILILFLMMMVYAIIVALRKKNRMYSTIYVSRLI